MDIITINILIIAICCIVTFILSIVATIVERDWFLGLVGIVPLFVGYSAIEAFGIMVGWWN